MKLTFLGGASEVGRSCILLDTGSTTIMMDSGVKIGGKNEFPEITREQLGKVSAIFITHAHLDHCCYLPHLYAMGYRGPIYATKPTIELLSVQIADYIRLSTPLDVDNKTLQDMSKHLRIAEYRKPIKLRDVTVEFLNAGHILGSALLNVTAGGKTVVYTGDINLAKTKLLEGADLQGLKADTLITESTYGSKSDIFPSEREMAKEMAASIKETLKTGGKVIVPSFGVGRAQEVLLFLDDFMNSGGLPKVPIYVDGMINKVMRIHRHNVIYCRDEIQKRILMSDYDPFKSSNFVIVEKKGMRDKIVKEGGGSIIVTTSGMLTGGPVVYYMKKLAGEAGNKLILVGYQPEGTPGRALLDGAKKLDFHDTKLNVRLKVQIFHMSAHADRKQLETIPKKLAGLKNIFIVHGEVSKAQELMHHFGSKYKVQVPQIGDTCEI